MSDPREDPRQQRRSSIVPYRPYLRDLVEGKRRWQHAPGSRPLPAASKDWHQRGYLPHRDEPGLVQFVTFRLADAIPAARRTEWQALLKIEDSPTRQRKLEDYLDRDLGASHLRRPKVAGLVEEALRFFHGTRYELLAWVVMPNHVHVLLAQREEPLGRVVRSWKSYTGRESNKELGCTGPFWAEDYWDTYMRNAEQARQTRHYIEGNPVKAHLVREARLWPWSSARFRDPYGRLVPPA